MVRSPTQAVKFKRRALGWSVAKLASESKRTVEEIRNFEDGYATDKQLIAELLVPIDSAIAQVLPFWEQVISDPDLLPISDEKKAIRKLKLVEFGKLLRDRRNKVQLSRLQLGKLAGLSDATIKFLETARHPPSRRTCQALVGVKELALNWSDVATIGYVGPAPTQQALAPAPSGQTVVPAESEPATLSPAEPKPAVHEQTASSAESKHAPDSGEIIEEETITYTRRIIRKK